MTPTQKPSFPTIATVFLINTSTLTHTKFDEKEAEQETSDMLKVASMVNVDTFIEQATRIADLAKRNPNLSVEAREEARALCEQFENYLESRGLKA